MHLQKWYTRIIGVFFTLVAISLFIDIIKFSHRPETWHKVFHVLLGIIVLKFGWSNEGFYRPFCIANGAFFTFVALFGFTFQNFANLDAFNTVDTILHSIVGVSGLAIGFFGKK